MCEVDSMLLEVAKPVALALCMLSLCAVFYTAFLIPASEGSSDTLGGGVSCATSSSCHAVGYYVATGSGHISASADQLVGSAWTTLPTPTNPR